MNIGARLNPILTNYKPIYSFTPDQLKNLGSSTDSVRSMSSKSRLQNLWQMPVNMMSTEELAELGYGNYNYQPGLANGNTINFNDINQFSTGAGGSIDAQSKAGATAHIGGVNGPTNEEFDFGTWQIMLI